MNNVRHRIITSISLSLLQEETKRLMKDGWRPIGEPALAAPADLVRPPYWAQAMYLGEAEIPLESQKIELPPTSRLSNPPTVPNRPG
jgi:hypothetical protein